MYNILLRSSLHNESNVVSSEKYPTCTGRKRERERVAVGRSVFEFEPTNLTSEIFLHVHLHSVIHH